MAPGALDHGPRAPGALGPSNKKLEKCWTRRTKTYQHKRWTKTHQDVSRRTKKNVGKEIPKQNLCCQVWCALQDFVQGFWTSKNIMRTYEEIVHLLFLFIHLTKCLQKLFNCEVKQKQETRTEIPCMEHCLTAPRH